MKLTQEIKDKWLEALKSRKYIKCTGQLRTSFPSTPVQHCCLGVLCEIVPEFKLTEDGKGIVDIINSYEYLKQFLNIPQKQFSDLWQFNDFYPTDNYKNVIPLIEEIKIK